MFMQHHSNHSAGVAISLYDATNKQVLLVIALSISLLLMIQLASAQQTSKIITGSLQSQMPGKLQWLGKPVIDKASTVTVAQSGDMFEYLSTQAQPGIWPAVQKEPLPMVMTQVDAIPNNSGMALWNSWLATNGLKADNTSKAANNIRYSISYLIDANGQLMEASIKGDDSLLQDAVLQQFIQMNNWKPAQWHAQAVAYRGNIDIYLIR